MKNKELTKGLCISLASAVVACSPMAIMAAEDTSGTEAVSEQEAPAPVEVPETPAPEPEPVVVPETPAPEPEPVVVPDTPSPEPAPSENPDTPSPEPTPSENPDTPSPSENPSDSENSEETSDPNKSEQQENSEENPKGAQGEAADPEKTEESEDPNKTEGSKETKDPEKSEESEKSDEPSEKDKKAAQAVISQIDALANKELTVKDKDAVASVRKEYNALSDKAKALVTNYDKLTAMESQIEKLVKEEELIAKVGDPVYYKDTASIYHAGKEFYLKNLEEIYHLSFSEDIQKILDDIVKEYLEENEVDTEGLKDNTLLRVRNWQDILAVYVYRQIQDGKDTFVLDEKAKDSLKEIFAEMNTLVHDPENAEQVAFSNDHIDDYIKKNKISAKDQQILKKYLETDCKLLCATVTAYPGFVRESVGEGVSEERVQVIAAAYSAIGKVGYFWGGKYPQVGENPAWGTFVRVEAEGSRTTGMLRAYGLDCSGFVSWAVVNGYESSSMQNAIGEGTSDQWEKAAAVRIEDVQPGDLVFQDGPAAGSQNHVGIVVGKTDSGDLVVVHCSSGQNGVTVGDAYGAGFRYVRRASFYPSKEEAEKEFVDITGWISEDAEADQDNEDTKDQETFVETEEPAVEEETAVETEEPAVEEETAVETEEPAVEEETAVETEESAVEEETAVETEEPAVEEETAAETEESAEEEESTDEITAEPEAAELPEDVLAKLQLLSQPMVADVFVVPEEIGNSDFLTEEAQAEVFENAQVVESGQSIQAVTQQKRDTEITETEDFSDKFEIQETVLEEQKETQESQIKEKAGLPVEKVQEEQTPEESFDGDGELPQDILEKLLLLNQSDLLKENLLDVSTASSLNQLQKFNESDLKD